MSIIQDALKKADRKSPTHRDLTIGYAQARKEEIAEIVTVPHGGWAKTRYIAYAIILFILVSIFAASRFSTLKSKNTITQVSIKNKVEPIRVVQPITPAVEKEVLVKKDTAVKNPSEPTLPKESIIQPNEFILSGIMHLEDGPRAIINNMRVSKGDDIDGAKVVSITDETVVLKKQDSEIKLRLK